VKGSFEQFRSLGAAQFVSMDRKTREKIAIMRVGGKKLAGVKQDLIDHAVAGTPFEKLEEIAQAQIAKEGAVPSFSTVEGHSWATCISKNEGVVTGYHEITLLKMAMCSK
jgi:methionine aminopeptidase